ncbi:NicO-domain-containing protein [Polyporus arcularius HHB13444]|uniref:Nickel/cobalt efflux system n=1 Tax=Polyporus arcularius HHB13444 TaxID=1314778 RepID=A0A5C3P4L3_9APHY|nr:NicO-domain-containing protein [Polyporus arcularius HHB13444]
MARRLSGILSVRRPRLPALTLFGRSLLLLTAELLANAVCWIVCAILFSRGPATRPVLSLALLAWTIGLRHALDADHISAIDNATRSLINLGQLPVTCGLFFSLGHSTIVIVVNVAIAISTNVYNHIDGVGEIGGIVGAAVSASFLFIVGLANSIILYRILRKRHRRASRAAKGEEAPHTKDDDEMDEEPHRNTLMMRLIGPVVTFVDRPWKMYPVGLLFGFGFDTASSIALLAISAIAKRDPDGQQINPADIVILPLLFTVGMTLIDSLDSVIMLYSYAGFPERSFAIFERRPPATSTSTNPADSPLPRVAQSAAHDHLEAAPVAEVPRTQDEKHVDEKAVGVVTVTDPEDASESESESARRRTLRVKHNTMSNLSILLTVMSIMVAFSISLITTMGLIGDHCTPCQNAANAEDGGRLAGRWWRGWAHANDNSGYIGAAIVGSFVFVVGSWYGARFLYRKWQRQQARQ